MTTSVRRAHHRRLAVVLLVAALGISACSAAPATDDPGGATAGASADAAPGASAAPDEADEQPAPGGDDDADVPADGGADSDAPSSGAGGQDEPQAAPDELAEPDDARAESATPEDGKQEAIFDRVAGNDTQKCVDVGDNRDLRSGEIVGGPFDTAISAWGTEQRDIPNDTVRLYWVPLNSEKMPGVTVVATNERSGETVKTTRDEYGDAEQWKFYDTSFQLPDAGTWTLEVTSGQDSGCFRIRLEG